jgi:hypothetical protein
MATVRGGAVADTSDPSAPEESGPPASHEESETGAARPPGTDIPPFGPSPEEPPPRRSRRRWLYAAAAVVVVAGGVVGGLLATRSGGTAPLRELLPTGVSGCNSKVTPFENHPPGMTGVFYCRIDSVNGQLFAYQFDNSVDYQAAFNKLNQLSGFVPGHAGSTCPTSAQAGGRTTWYTASNALYPKTPGQILECYEVQFNSDPNNPLQATYLWTIPTENAFMQAIAGSNESMQQLDTWWAKNGGPNTR